MYKILSVGGSIIIPPTGFNIVFLKKFRALILTQIKRGQKFILVVGGGITARTYQEAARKAGAVSDEELDWLGIHTTILNGQFVRLLFRGYVYDDVITNPLKWVRTSKPIIIAGGWEPGSSTDLDAVLLAKTYDAKEVINLSNVDYIYSADPRKNHNAKKITKISWGEFRQLVGNRWHPGANFPFDPKASSLAKRYNLTVKFVKGTALAQVQAALAGKKFRGSTIAG